MATVIGLFIVIGFVIGCSNESPIDLAGFKAFRPHKKGIKIFMFARAARGANNKVGGYGGGEWSLGTPKQIYEAVKVWVFLCVKSESS